MTRVRNLVSWAGDDFSRVPGDEFDLDDAVAVARQEAGLLEILDPPEPEQYGPPAPPVSRARRGK